MFHDESTAGNSFKLWINFNEKFFYTAILFNASSHNRELRVRGLSWKHDPEKERPDDGQQRCPSSHAEDLEVESREEKKLFDQ